MSLIIGVPKESGTLEKRVSCVPEVAKKFVGLGARIILTRGAGLDANFGDADYQAEVVDSNTNLYAAANVILRVAPPTVEDVRAMKSGTVLIGFLQPYNQPDLVRQLASSGIESYAVELIARISRAQSMDALSSQAACAGYQCVLMAAAICPKFFPMLTYAAGTLRPAQVLVIGAGVAGLQAIATAKRIGAVVQGYDVRPETKEQIESLGARFVDTGVSAAGGGGYARELTDEEKQRQAERLGKAVAGVDVLITTAAIPGRKSPLIITEPMLSAMKPGAVVVDMAAEGGGNCAWTKAGETVSKNAVTVLGPRNLPSRMPTHASEMYAKNLFNFISPFIKEGEMTLPLEDEILKGACLTRGGQVVNEAVKKTLNM